MKRIPTPAMPIIGPIVCICGHEARDHEPDNGACEDGRCQCPEYVELCPACQHRQTSHNHRKDGTCTRERRRDRQRCRCDYYSPITQ